LDSHPKKKNLVQAILLLSANLDDANEEVLTSPMELVPVNISLNAYNNARQFYTTKKKSEAKEHKTRDMAQSALKAAEEKAMEELRKVRELPIFRNTESLLAFALIAFAHQIFGHSHFDLTCQ
jgi:hypothetical protein